MEFVMLDAYERITLEPGAKGLYKKTFTVPDTYGIFKFRVHYRRPGYTVLSFSTQVGGRGPGRGPNEMKLSLACRMHARGTAVSEERSAKRTFRGPNETLVGVLHAPELLFPRK